jgi:hypothetical protein
MRARFSLERSAEGGDNISRVGVKTHGKQRPFVPIVSPHLSAPPRPPYEPASDCLQSSLCELFDRPQHQLLKAGGQLCSNFHAIIAKDLLVIDLNDSAVSASLSRL